MVLSINNVFIRLPNERWEHIIANHPEMADEKAIILDIVSNPDQVKFGDNGELLALREISPGKWLVVVYRENAEDGFIITAIKTSKPRWLNNKKQAWP